MLGHMPRSALCALRVSSFPGQHAGPSSHTRTALLSRSYHVALIANSSHGSSKPLLRSMQLEAYERGKETDWTRICHDAMASETLHEG
jgi:hypothetical protein